MRKQLFRIAALAATASLALGTMVATTATAAPKPQEKALRHTRTINFWTVDKVRQAKSRDFVMKDGKMQLQPKPQGAQIQATSSWNNGGLVQKTTGKVLFSFGSDYYVCSASVAKDSATDRSVILTAGHCVFDQESHSFADNWMFIPDYDSTPVDMDRNGNFCDLTRYGCWTPDAFVANYNFTKYWSFNLNAALYDFGFVAVSEGGKAGRLLEDVVGAQNIQFSKGTIGAMTYSFGYPAGAPYTGRDLTYSNSALGTDSATGGQTYRISSTMTGGCSGGPWFQNFSTYSGAGTMISVNSYGRSMGDMQGPILGTAARNAYNRALTASYDTILYS